MKYALPRHMMSAREAEVLSNVALGKSNKQIASELFVTEKTVKFHLTNIYKKIGVKTRSEAIVKYFNKDFHTDNLRMLGLLKDQTTSQEGAQEANVSPSTSTPSSQGLPSGFQGFAA